MEELAVGFRYWRQQRGASAGEPSPRHTRAPSKKAGFSGPGSSTHQASNKGRSTTSPRTCRLLMCGWPCGWALPPPSGRGMGGRPAGPSSHAAALALRQGCAAAAGAAGCCSAAAKAARPPPPPPLAAAQPCAAAAAPCRLQHAAWHRGGRTSKILHPEGRTTTRGVQRVLTSAAGGAPAAPPCRDVTATGRDADDATAG